MTVTHRHTLQPRRRLGMSIDQLTTWPSIGRLDSVDFVSPDVLLCALTVKIGITLVLSIVHVLSSLRVLPADQPRPQGLLLVQNGGQRNPWPRLPKWLQKFVRISLGKHDEMSSFRLDNGFRLQKTNRAASR